MWRARALPLAIGAALSLALSVSGLANNPLEAQVTFDVACSLAIAEAGPISLGSFAGFTNGPQAGVSLHLIARCNKKTGYTVFVKGDAFASPDGDPSTFPVETVEFSNDNIAYNRMAMADGEVRQVLNKTTAAGDQFPVYLRVNLAGTEAAGTYTTTLTFSIVPN